MVPGGLADHHGPHGRADSGLPLRQRPVDPTRLPLTGGASTDAFLLGGGSVLTLALGLLLWERRRRLRGPSR
ncbi:LPXTG cell wall anchor domain-containing protein [Rathayibacter sp. AY1E1]|uniref:LPXTG cell wall anchor domain-containing protein n=1 Tax=Rathayibacter sp. AY1E1 TaxID=2080549 RepID=UPI0035BE48A0